MIAVALPTIGRDLYAAEFELTQWLAVSYLVVSLAGQAPGGHLADRLGLVRALVLGAVVTAVGAVVGMTGGNLPTLAAARIAMAAGGAITVPAAMALIRNRARSESRTWVFGLFSATMATAAALGPPLGGEIIAVMDWRGIFAASLLLAVVAILCLTREARQIDARPEGNSFDWAGPILLFAGLGLATIAAAPTLRGGNGWWLLAAGLLVIFVVRAARVQPSMIDHRMFAERGFAAGCVVIGAQNLAMYALLFQFPILFAAVGPDAASEMGRTLFAMMACMVMSSLAGGWLARWLGLRRSALFGASVALTGWWLLGDPERLARPSEAIVPLIVIGSGIGFSMAPAQTASMEVAPRHRAGSAAGLVSMARYLGAIVGLSVLAGLTADGHAGSAAVLLNGAGFLVALIAAVFLPSGLQPFRTSGGWPR